MSYILQNSASGAFIRAAFRSKPFAGFKLIYTTDLNKAFKWPSLSKAQYVIQLINESSKNKHEIEVI